MNASAHRLLRWIGGTIAVALIAAAVLLSALRIALPFAADYRAQLEHRVADYLGTSVSIGEMQVEWHGFGPRLRLVDLRLAGPAPDRGPIHFDEAHVDLGLVFGGDRALSVRIDSISLVGLDLVVGLDADGRLSLLGQSVPPKELVPRGDTPPPIVRRAVAWLLDIDRLQLLDTEIRFVDSQGERGSVSGIDLRLNNDATAHRASLVAQLPASWGGELRVVLDANGREFGVWSGWNGRIYVGAGQLALARWSALLDRGPVGIDGGRADLAAWIEFGGGRVTDVSARIATEGLRLTGGGSTGAVAFERLGGRLHWYRADKGWQLDTADLDVRRNDRSWTASGLSVAHVPPAGSADSRGDSRRDGPGRWRVGADFLRIEDALALARVMPLPSAWRERLQALAPRGDVHALRATGSGPQRFTLRARLANVAWQATAQLPGVHGLDGVLRASDRRGRLALATTDARVDLPQLMRAPLSFAAVDGTLRFERAGNAWRIHSDALRLRNEDGRAGVQLAVAQSPDRPLWLNISVDLADVDLAAVPRYLPARVLPDPVIEGLERTLQAGRITQGRLRILGPAAAFPYRDGGGTFTVDAAGNSGRIAYAPGWPDLQDVAGRVHIDGVSLEVELQRGRVFGIDLRALRAHIADLAEARLRVDLRSDAPVADLVRLVNASPLAQPLGPFFDGARGEGRADFALDLMVPLLDPDAARVTGRLDFRGARLAQPRFNLDLRALRGVLGFNRRGITAQGLDARLRGSPVVLSARSASGETPANLIRVSGAFTPGQLVPQLPDAIAARAHGASPWRLQVRIPLTSDAPVMLAGASDLAQTAIDLPAPLGKPAGPSRRLAFSLPIDESDTHRLRLEYGSNLRALVALAGPAGELAVERASLRFGADGKLQLRPNQGVHLAGRIDRLDLLGWTMLASGTGSGSGPGFSGADLSIKAADYGGRSVSDLRLEAQPDRDRWRVRVRANELAGEARIPRDLQTGQALRIRLDWLDLGLLSAAGGEAGTDSALAGLHPARLPPLDVRIGRLKTRSATLHDVALVTVPSSDGLAIHRLEFSNDNLQAKGQGRWNGGGNPRTSLRLKFTSQDFGAGLDSIGYGSTIVDGQGKIITDLDWPGAPWQGNLAGLGGHAQIDVTDGLIPEVDPGAARVLGLLSLRALPQLLSLDFRGLTRSGYAFDRIDGRVDFADGNAYSRGLEIDGPVGEMRITGRTGLVARDYDQVIRFRPELSTALPLIGALSGGPVAGLAVALVQGLLRNVGADVEKASELEYRLTGTWDDPKVQRVNEPPESAPSAPAGQASEALRERP